MKIATPIRTEGKVWVDQFNVHFLEWVRGQRTDAAAFRKAMDALRHVAEREPAAAGFVANLVSTLLRQHASVMSPQAAEEFATRGLDAIALVAERSELRIRTGVDLQVCLARACQQQQRPAEALAHVNAALAALATAGRDEISIDRLLEAQALAVRARAFESLVEYGLALADYERAAELGIALQDQEAMGKVLIELAGLDFPGQTLPKEVVQAEIQLLWRALSLLTISATAGAGRCAVFARPDTVDARLDAIAGVAASNGVAGIEPVELMPLVMSADPARGSSVVESLARSARKLGVYPDEFEAALAAALAKAARADKAAALSGDPLVLAAVEGVLFLHESRPARRKERVTKFIDLIAELDQRRDVRMADPAVRTVFEKPAAAALLELLPHDGGEIPWDEHTRRVMARLIDYDFSGLTPLDSWVGQSPSTEGLVHASQLARDHLARVRSAMRDWQETLALIVRSAGDRTMFIAFTAEAAPVAWVSDGDYDAKARALARRIAADTLEMVDRGKLPDVAGLRQAAQAAYDSLPEGLRSLIGACDRLMVLPDPDLREGEMPFELLHDEGSWLAASKVIARFPDLRALVRCLERTSRPDRRRRFLGLAYPDAPGYPPLRFARDEVDTARKQMASLGWDTPVLGDSLASDELLDLLPLAQHLHIASHGSRAEDEEPGSGAGQENIVLPSGLLPSYALMARFFPRMPTAFINACELGLARWAGAGRVQSMAYAFISSGSAAVVANLLPVEDRVANTLARAFYEALASGDFGSSLRIARRQFAGKGAHPLLWATTILAGDPTCSLRPAPRKAGACERYLDSLLGQASAHERAAAIEEVRRRLQADPDDMRLRASLALLNEMESPELASAPDAYRIVAEMCKVAYEVGHLPLLGYVVEVGRNVSREDASRDYRLRYLDNAIHLFESLEHEDASWRSRLNAALAEWFKVQRDDRAPRLVLRGAGDEDGDGDDDQPREEAPPDIQAIADAQTAVHARALRAGRGPIPRLEESAAGDVLWNAVIASYRFHLEDMRERTDIGRDVVSRLIAHGALPAKQASEATPAVVGLLDWLWSMQNRLLLDHQFIEGQVGVMRELVASLQNGWLKEPWYEPLPAFERFLLDALEKIENAPYDDRLYPLIDKTFADVESRARAVIGEASTAGHAPEAMATVLGMLMVHNTYSFTGGSVPETLDRRLVEVNQAVGRGGESCFLPWLDGGFKSVREWVPDLKWRWENDVPDASAKASRAVEAHSQ